MNHIDDSFLHCLVFKEHRRIASAVRRSFFTGDSTILLHPRGIVKHFFEVFSSVLLPSCATTNAILHEHAQDVNIFLKIFHPLCMPMDKHRAQSVFIGEFEMLQMRDIIHIINREVIAAVREAADRRIALSDSPDVSQRYMKSIRQNRA